MEHPELLCPLRASLLRPPGCRVRVKWQSICRVSARGQARRGVPHLFVSFQSLQKQEGDLLNLDRTRESPRQLLSPLPRPHPAAIKSEFLGLGPRPQYF